MMLPACGSCQKKKKEEGATLVDNAAGFFRVLRGKVETGDSIAIRLSGGVVEDCLWHATEELLGGSSRLEGVEVERVIVDMTTSMAAAESIIPLTVQERRTMFINLLDNRFSNDPRLTVLPESE